jgi:hypothetical protein
MFHRIVAEMVIREREQEIQRVLRRRLANHATGQEPGAPNRRRAITRDLRAWFGRLRRGRIQAAR